MRKFKRISKKEQNNRRYNKKWARKYLIERMIEHLWNTSDNMSCNRRLQVKMYRKRHRWSSLNKYWSRKGKQYRKYTIEGI